jgi:HD-GYP domain-containing protein (c-di-GMP phosphodiesterase class II)
MEAALDGTVQAAVAITEARDPYTAGHERRVGQLAVAIAAEMGFGKDALKGLQVGAALHDIGKIFVPAEILNKPGSLSDTEFSIIKTHPAGGYEILKVIRFPWPVADMALQHQERLDGSGYPEGLKDGEIMLESRILAVADVVEAMSSHRPYRAALGMDAALAEIKKNRGTLFDAEVVDITLRLFKEGFAFSE